MLELIIVKDFLKKNVDDWHKMINLLANPKNLSLCPNSLWWSIKHIIPQWEEGYFFCELK